MPPSPLGRENGTVPRSIELQPIMEDGPGPLLPVRFSSQRLRDLRQHRLLRWTEDPLVRTAAKNLLLILTWYFFSTCLSIWNKRLVGKEHGVLGLGPFPAPMLITSVQFAFQHLLARAVLATQLISQPSKESFTWEDWFKKVVPNGISTGLDIGLSNYSLMLITLSFYTMCKSTTPVFLLSFAFIWGIEKPSWSLAGVVCVICSGLVLLVYGETHFDLVGFLVVMGASMLAGFRWTITQVLLQGDSKHHGSGGPLQVLYHLTPVMSVTVLIMSLLVERLPEKLPGSPYFESAYNVGLTIGIMLFGGCIAFLMVWTEFKVIQETSALTFMVAGTFKEIVTVFSAVLFLGETFTAVNGVGLCILILGVVLFNWTKYRKMKEATEETTEADKAHPTPSRAARYSLVDGSQAGSDEESSRPSTPAKLSTPVMRGGNSITPFADNSREGHHASASPSDRQPFV